MEDFTAYMKEIEPKLIEIRRKLHSYPELGKEEEKTCEIIVEALKDVEGLTITKGLAHGHGVMAQLEGTGQGEGEKKCVLLRADIDALPIEEINDLPYRSKHPGRMHACGHDAHATWIIGAAMLLSRLRDRFYGTVKFVFQPGEEVGFGAKEMILEDRVLENPTVDMAFAAHGWPSIEAGKVGIAARYAFGCPGGFTIKIKGKGGHGSWPYKAVNPILVGSTICTLLPQILSDKIPSVEPRIISVGAIHAGEKGVGNIIPDTCEINGTIRATKVEVMKQLKDEMEKVIAGVCNMHGAEYEFSCRYSLMGVKNHKALIPMVKESVGKVLGPEMVEVLEEDNLGGENFCEFSSRVPSVYLFMGIKNEAIAPEFSLHSPKYMLDESVLVKAAGCFASIAIDALKK
ncbi:MAG: amidohydrolase [Lachnospiraceae bacterium]|nr:amidohydrolase [Lachnospiraceae bacterium]